MRSERMTANEVMRRAGLSFRSLWLKFSAEEKICDGLGRHGYFVIYIFCKILMASAMEGGSGTWDEGHVCEIS
jgi:hypothetical protein